MKITTALRSATGHVGGATASKQGFGAIELLVCLALLALVAAWGMPNLVAPLRSAAVLREATEFMQAAYLARSEAIKRAAVVSLCPSRDGATCAATSDWGIGWIIFVNSDRDSPAVRDPGEPLLRAHGPWAAGRVTGNRTALSFRAFAQSGTTGTLTFCDARTARDARAVVISQTGRPRLTDRDSGGGPLDCG